MNPQVMDLLKKIKELAYRGIDGEKASAQSKLEKIMAKHGITESDLEGELRRWVKFWYKSASDKRLMLQVLVTVVDYETYEESKTENNLWFFVTASENIEFEYKWAIYKKLYKEELEVFYSAFIMKNGIYSDKPATKTIFDLTPEELEAHSRAEAMAQSIKKASIHKQIDK